VVDFSENRSTNLKDTLRGNQESISPPLPARYETNRNDLRAVTAHKQLNSRKRFTRVAGIEDRGPRWMRRWVKRFRRAMFHAMLVSIALSLARRNGLMAVNVNNFYPQLQRPLVRFLNVGEQFVDTGEEIFDAIMHEPENASRRRSPPLLPYASTLPPPEFMHIKERGSPLLSGLGERASAAARYVKSIIGDSGTNHGFIEDNAESYSKQGILSNYYREVVGPREELNLKKYVTE